MKILSLPDLPHYMPLTAIPSTPGPRLSNVGFAYGPFVSLQSTPASNKNPILSKSSPLYSI